MEIYNRWVFRHNEVNHVGEAPHKDKHASCFFVEVLFILLEKGCCHKHEEENARRSHEGVAHKLRVVRQ